jgi:hypothetical protein
MPNKAPFYFDKSLKMTTFAEGKLHLGSVEQAPLHSVCIAFAKDNNQTTRL